MTIPGSIVVAPSDVSVIIWPPKGGGGSFPGGTNSLIISDLLASAMCLMNYQYQKLRNSS